MSEILTVNAPRLYAAREPERDARYRAFVRRFPCAGCRARFRIQASHTGAHGLSEKASDYGCIPLCFKCHPRFDADPRGFARRKRIDVAGRIRTLNRLWKAEQERKR